MPTLSRVIAIELAGDPPAALGLAPLTTTATSIETVLAAVAPYMVADAEVCVIRDADALETLLPAAGLTLVYLVGHAWIAEGRYTVAAREGVGTRTIAGADLLEQLARLIPPGARGVCLVDTCVAAALRDDLPATIGERCTFIFASGAAENALEYPLDEATRFALAFHDVLAASTPRQMDVVRLALDIEHRISATALMPPQAVSYWSAGTPLLLERGTRQGGARRGWRTYRVVRAVLLTFGALTAVAAIVATNYYYTHERIRIELGDLHTIASDLRVELYRLRPATNTRERLATYDAGRSPTIRAIAPSVNLLIVVAGTYRDGRPRVINFHLDHRQTWSLGSKRVILRAPSAADVRRHPEMAFIPAGDWLEGEERRPAVNAKPFWIDIAPVTVEAYLPLARRFAEARTIEDSVLLHDIENQAGVEATGLTQVPTLMGDLGAIFSVLDAAERPVARAEPYEDTAAMLPRVRIACATCPAPMTLHEARAYCQSRGMRLPARGQWEFAARGADGRRFPWGEAWNDVHGNAGLPTQVGKLQRPEPSAQFGSGASPHGVIDMVGNEGDWIEPDGGYERIFMGGLYRFNGDDCTVFAQTPDTGDVLPLYEVTCRCVSP